MYVNGLCSAVRADPVQRPGIDVAEVECVAEPARRFRKDEGLLLQKVWNVVHGRTPVPRRQKRTSIVTP
jgi:hypothetical protein